MMPMSTAYEHNGRVHQKRRTRDALIAAAREMVARGETPTVEAAAETASISRATAYRYFPNQRTLLAAAHPETAVESLTPREIEVLQLISEGLVNREIGHRLFLSEETVKSHVRHLLAKLQEVAPVNNNMVKSFIAQQALGLPRSY